MGYSESDVQRLLDEAAIRRKLQTYCRGIDRSDPELLASVYHEDSLDVHSNFRGTGREFALHEFASPDRPAAAWACIGESLFEFRGPDVALVETYVATTRARETDGQWTLERFYGRYIDRFEQRNGEWKIAFRGSVRDFAWKQVVDAPMRPRNLQGARDRSDPSWAHFEGD